MRAALLTFVCVAVALTTASPARDTSLTPFAAHFQALAPSNRVTSAALKPVARAGLTGDLCSATNACAAPRTCIDGVAAAQSQQREPCTTATLICFCVPETETRCTNSDPCSDGERCIENNDSGICWSCATAGLGDFELLDAGEKCDGTAEHGANSTTVAPDATVPETTDAVMTDAVTTDAATTEPATTEASTAEAATTESTTAQTDSSGSTSAAPAQETPGAAPTLLPPVNSDTEPCVAVSHLGHLRRTDLVFRTHRPATVLCDARDSCATRAHVVTFRGRPMTMGRYCGEHATCVVRRMEVNSPRMAAGGVVRVASNSNGLLFTPFSARYGTRAEELLMQTLVWAGW